MPKKPQKLTREEQLRVAAERFTDDRGVVFKNPKPRKR